MNLIRTTINATIENEPVLVDIVLSSEAPYCNRANIRNLVQGCCHTTRLENGVNDLFEDIATALAQEPGTEFNLVDLTISYIERGQSVSYLPEN